MKRIKSCLFILSLVGLTFLASCGGGGDDTPQLTPEEQRLLDLAGSSTGVTWVTTSVRYADAPSNFFEDFTITFRGTATSKTYTSTNGSPIFLPSGGRWDFNGTNINEIILDDENTFQIGLNTNVTPHVLTMTIEYTSSGGVAAGINGANGKYEFIMEEQ